MRDESVQIETHIRSENLSFLSTRERLTRWTWFQDLILETVATIPSLTFCCDRMML